MSPDFFFLLGFFSIRSGLLRSLTGGPGKEGTTLGTKASLAWGRQCPGYQWYSKPSCTQPDGGGVCGLHKARSVALFFIYPGKGRIMCPVETLFTIIPLSQNHFWTVTGFKRH